MFTENPSPDRGIWEELARELQNELKTIGWREGTGSIFVRYPGDPRKHLVKKGVA
jgi:hypothetical protein